MKKYIIMLCGISIKKLRTDKGFKFEYVSMVLKLDKTKLSRIENGQQAPDPETLFKLCNFYNTSVSGFWCDIELEVLKKYPPKKKLISIFSLL
jgi:transcriptional regulator with XRE-family HTH domain